MDKSVEKVRDEVIVGLLSQGKSMSSVAKTVGCSRETVAQKSKKYRELIEAETRKIIDIVPEITEQLRLDVKTSKELSKHLSNPMENENRTGLLETSDMLNFMKLSYAKQADVLRAAGVYPSNGTTIVQNIYSDNRTQVFSPVILKALGGLLEKEETELVEEEDWKDAEFDEVE